MSQLKLPNLKYSFTGTLQRNSRTGDLKNKYAPFKNLIKDGALSQFTTNKINFDLNHPVDILVQESYDGSVNLILNDDKNRPRMINSRFSTAENDTFIVPDHYGNKDTSLYEDDALDIDTSLYKTISKIPKMSFDGLEDGGNLKAGTYHFYFKLADNDDNETDFVLESSIVQCHIGAINNPSSIRMGLENENTHKAVKFTFNDLDTSYDYLKVYYTRNTSGQEGSAIISAHSIETKYPILDSNLTSIVIFGTEPVIDIDIRDINPLFEYVDTAKSQTICQNRLFFGNISKPVIPYEELKEFSLRITPKIDQTASIGSIDDDYEDNSLDKNYNGYYNAKNIYYRVGVWPGEYYRCGIVYLMNDFTLSPVFNIRGLDFNYYADEATRIQLHKDTSVNYDEDGYIQESKTRENIYGIIHINKDINLSKESANPIGIKFTYDDLNDDVYDAIKGSIKGFFFVRQERIPITIAQGIAIGKTKNNYGNLPCLKIQNDFQTESFLLSNIYKKNILHRSLVNINSSNVDIKAALVPDAFVKEALFNQIFVSQSFKYQKCVQTEKFVLAKNSQLRYKPFKYVWSSGDVKSAKFTMVNSGISLTTNGDDYFSSKAGEAEITSTFSSVLHDWTAEGSDTETQFSTNSLTRKNAADQLATSLMQDNLIRGLFGSYVGISDNRLAFGDIFNIMDNAYEDSVKYERQAEFVRKSSNTPYYAISERMDLSEINTGVTCYRGDCFICNYTHRMLRNFIDPELPTNDKIIEPTSWSDNFAVLTKFRSNLNGKKTYINEPVPLFKAKMINDGTGGSNWETYLSTVLAPGNEAGWSTDLAGKLALNDGEDIDWSQDKARMVLPSDSKYAKLGQFGETVGVANTWYERGLDKINRSDVNAVGLGHWVTFRILSNNNLCMRDIDIMETKEKAIFNKERSFFPLEKLSLSNQNKIAESNKINGASNKVLSSRTNFIGMDTPYDKQQFDTRIMFSDLTTSDAYKNGFRVFTGLNYKDYPKTYGALTSIKEFNGNILAIMEHGVLNIPVNERSMSGAGAGGAVYINTSTVLPSNPLVISANHGSSWGESICVTENYVYGIDTSSKKIWRTDGQSMEILSDFKLQKFLNDNINLKEWDKFVQIGARNVKTHYNAFKKDVMFVFYNGDVSWNLCYNEYLKIFTTFYSWTPSYSENINNTFISFDLADTQNIINTTLDTLKATFSSKFQYNPVIPNVLDASAILFSLTEDPYEVILPDPVEECYEENKYFSLIPDKESGSYKIIYNAEFADDIANLKNIQATIIYNGTKIKIRATRDENLCNKFWKHGQAGIIDNQGKIKPTNWYDKQEKFEFEVVVATNAQVQKIYNNLLLISNKAKPKEFSFEIVGESYDWFNYKDIINWINEKSPNESTRRNFYSFVLRNTQGEISKTFEDYPKLPDKPDNYTIRKLPYIRRVRKDRTGEYIDDQFETNSTEVRLIQDELLSEQRVNISQKGNDIKKLGRIAGNMEYKEDSWRVEIRPINFKYAYLDNTGNLQFMKENSSRIRDKYCKIRVKYSGEDLVILQGLKTLFNYSHA